VLKALAGSGRCRRRADGDRAGARDYLAKPFNDQQLLLRVARLLRPRTDRRTLEESMDDLEMLLA
jgi:DNA-binding response OmpR family regulator